MRSLTWLGWIVVGVITVVVIGFFVLYVEGMFNSPLTNDYEDCQVYVTGGYGRLKDDCLVHYPELEIQ